MIREPGDRGPVERLADLRALRSVTQVQLADAIGSTQSAISRIERQPDLHVSTLGKYVTGTGGRLRLFADYDSYEVELDLAALRAGAPPLPERQTVAMGLPMILDVPEMLIPRPDVPLMLTPQPGDQYPVLALTREGNLVGYYQTVTAALEAGGIILYVAPERVV